jgi:hypothetical protein
MELGNGSSSSAFGGDGGEAEETLRAVNMCNSKTASLAKRAPLGRLIARHPDGARQDQTWHEPDRTRGQFLIPIYTRSAPCKTGGREAKRDEGAGDGGVDSSRGVDAKLKPCAAVKMRRICGSRLSGMGDGNVCTVPVKCGTVCMEVHR